MFVNCMRAAALSAMAAFCLSGCLAMTAYVDPALGDVKPAERVQVADKQPVQFIFAFQTNGAANSNATNATNHTIDNNNGRDNQ